MAFSPSLSQKMTLNPGPPKLNLYFKNICSVVPYDILGGWVVFLGRRIETNIPEAQVDG